MSTTLAKQESNQAQQQARVRRPRYSVRGGRDEYAVDVEMPGVAKDAYEVTVHGDELLIEGRRTLTTPENTAWLHRELDAEIFKLRLQLNVEVDTENIAAKSADGILSVTLPVAKEARPRQIPIN